MDKPRVLLADDHSIVVEGLSAILEPEVDVVGTVEDGRALLKAVAEHEPDIVITDLTMPKMTGDILAKEILSIRQDQPIILCSGFSERMGSEQALAMGIRRYLMKPISPQVLSETIRSVLENN